MGYEAAWDRQLVEHAAVVEGGDDCLIFVEHPPVLTLGANFHSENLLLSPEAYAGQGIEVIKTDRGGDVTYHGPGQLVIYPIFDLRRHGKDVHKWMRDLEETILLTLVDFGITGRRFPPHTGAWVDDAKVAAIGVKIKKWVSLHGIAINCSPQIHGFEGIVPCGIRGHGVTSLSQLLDREVLVAEVKPAVQSAFEKVFQIATS